MAKTILTGKYVAAGAAAASTLHTAAGRLVAILMSHAQATVQTITFYDDTAATPGTEIMKLNLDPTNSPYYLELPRHEAIAFDTGLHVVNGWCNLNVWSVDGG